MASDGDPRTFPIRIGPRSRTFLRFAFGVRPGREAVELGDDVVVRFGYFEFRVALTNVASWRIEGPWRWITAIGVRRSLRHGDVTFAGSPRGGVRLDFRTPVRWGLLRVPAIYLGVQDLEAFAGALERRGVPGSDERTTGQPRP